MSDDNPSRPSGPPALVYGQPDTTTADPGLFGPDSITWRIHGDPAAGIAGIRALLLQALQPEAMAGVARYSDFRDDPWGRLFRTAEYIGVTTFGTTEEARRASAIVRSVHHRLGLDDPHLLLWVHAGFVDSMVDTHRRSGAPLTAAEADRYVAEQVLAAELVGIDPATVPADMASLRQYFRYIRPELYASPDAVEAARFILVPPMSTRLRWATPAQPAWGVLAASAFALMPRWARRMYGAGMGRASILAAPAFAGLPTAELSASLTARGLRAALLAVPDQWRTGPHVHAARTRLHLTAA